MARAPHYLRFVRTIALVGAALPLPLVTITSGCSDSTTTSSGPAHGVGPAPGVMEGPPTGVRPADAAPDVGEDAADANDANDDGGGGPTHGTPELPVAWLV
ncbi:MAG TPA: hypothetical protein VIF62_01350 [Labilithrix sp.]